MSQGCALLILRSKGQRSRSWRMVIWKWFPDDNWLCNQPMIMKLHTLTPHEFVGVGGGPVLLQQYFQYAFICCPYMLPLLLYTNKNIRVVKNYKFLSKCSEILKSCALGLVSPQNEKKCTGISYFTIKCYRTWLERMWAMCQTCIFAKINSYF